jgi:hypothetical protein
VDWCVSLLRFCPRQLSFGAGGSSGGMSSSSGLALGTKLVASAGEAFEDRGFRRDRGGKRLANPGHRSKEGVVRVFCNGAAGHSFRAPAGQIASLMRCGPASEMTVILLGSVNQGIPPLYLILWPYNIVGSRRENLSR